MEELLSFYRRILENVKFEITEDGFIESNGELVTFGGKPLVLPTEEQLNSVIDKNENGEYEVMKIPFNPLNEDIVKGDSSSIKKLKHVIELRLGVSIAYVGELLLTLASNKDLQKQTNIEINKFLGELNKAQNIGIKQLVDDKSIDAWVGMWKNTIKKSKSFVSIYLKKAGIHEGTKYNRLATLTCDAYDELLNADKDTPVCGVKLRNKDITIFQILFSFILDGMDENGNMSFGTNESLSPAFVSLFTLYVSVMKRINKLANLLRKVNPTIIDDIIVEDLIDVNELEEVSQYSNAVAKVPNENDLSRTISSSSTRDDLTNSLANTTPIRKSGIASVKNTPYPSSPQPVRPQQAQQDTEDDPVLSAYMNSNQHIATRAPGMPNGNIGMFNHNIYQQPIVQQQPSAFSSLAVPANVGMPNVMNYQQPNMGYQAPQMFQGYQQPVMQPMVGNPAGYYAPQQQQPSLFSSLAVPANPYTR